MSDRKSDWSGSKPESNAIQVLLDCSNSMHFSQSFTSARRQQQSICGWEPAHSSKGSTQSRGSTCFRSTSSWIKTLSKTRRISFGVTGMKGSSQFSKRKEVD